MAKTKPNKPRSVPVPLLDELGGKEWVYNADHQLIGSRTNDADADQRYVSGELTPSVVG